MKFATHMVREEMFDISDLLGRLNELQAECLSQTSDIKVKFKHDGDEFIFVPQVQP